MTFKIKISGATTRHTVTDYRCQECGTTSDHFGDRSATPETIPCSNPTCNQGVAERIFSAPIVGTNWGGDVVKGESQERAAPSVMDTRALGAGGSLGDWKKQRSKMWRDKDIAEVKAKTE